MIGHQSSRIATHPIIMAAGQGNGSARFGAGTGQAQRPVKSFIVNRRRPSLAGPQVRINDTEPGFEIWVYKIEIDLFESLHLVSAYVKQRRKRLVDDPKTRRVGVMLNSKTDRCCLLDLDVAHVETRSRRQSAESCRPLGDAFKFLTVQSIWAVPESTHAPMLIMLVMPIFRQVAKSGRSPGHVLQTT